MSEQLATVEAEIDRDRYGRPMVTPPGGGKKQAYTRRPHHHRRPARPHRLERLGHRVMSVVMVGEKGHRGTRPTGSVIYADRERPPQLSGGAGCGRCDSAATGVAALDCVNPLHHGHPLHWYPICADCLAEARTSMATVGFEHCPGHLVVLRARSTRRPS